MSGPSVLSIGTTHPWNVAGVGRDLVVGGQLGVRVFTAIAAISAQDARGVHALEAVAPDLLRAQLDTLPWEAAGAVRVGALVTRANVGAVVTALRAHPALLAVVDPVLAASPGGSLIRADARDALRDDLATLPNVVLTPNLAEAAALLGSPPIARTTLAESAAALQRRGAHAVLLTGGHLDGEPTDTLATADRTEGFTDARIAASMRGTGCTLAMAMAASIAKGMAVRDAALAARAFVRAQLGRH